MQSLLLDGVLPDQGTMIRDCFDESIILGSTMLSFILIASLGVMNMLVGVLCEIVSVVSSVETEELTVTYVRSKILDMLRTGGVDTGVELRTIRISKGVFQYLISTPETVRIMQEIGVDVFGLVDFSDFIFRSGTDLTFEDFMELVLQLRGTNSSTVKDIVDMRRYVMTEMVQLGVDIEGSFEEVHRILEPMAMRMRHLPPFPQSPTAQTKTTHDLANPEFDDAREMHGFGEAGIVAMSAGAASSHSCTALAGIMSEDAQVKAEEKSLRVHLQKRPRPVQGTAAHLFV